MNRILQSAVLLVGVAACGAGSRPLAQDVPAKTNITGGERIAWDQELLPDSNIGDYQFAVYLNGERIELRSASCESEPVADGFICSAPLPRLRRGANSLEFVAILNGQESERSEPLELEFGGGAETQAAPAAADGHVRGESIARGLIAPTDLAALPDGRLLIAERRGAVRVVSAGLLDEPALLLRDVAVGGDMGLLALAVHPEFAQNRLVYLAYTARLPEGPPVYRVLRAREINNTLGEVAAVFESGAVGSTASMSARFGPDSKLYVGIGACAGCRPAVAGAVLRLNDDGTTPRDSASASPVFVGDLAAPVGLTWHGDVLWIADRRAASTTIIAAADGGSHQVGTTSDAGAAMLTSENTRRILMVRPHAGGIDRYQLRDGSLVGTGEPVLTGNTIVHTALATADGALYVCVSDSPDGNVELIRLAP